MKKTIALLSIAMTIFIVRAFKLSSYASPETGVPFLQNPNTQLLFEVVGLATLTVFSFLSLGKTKGIVQVLQTVVGIGLLANTLRQWPIHSDINQDINALSFFLYLVFILLIILEKEENAWKRKANGGMFLLFLLPTVGSAQSTVELGAQLSGNDVELRFSSHLHLDTETDLGFLTITEFAKAEALVMQGITWNSIGLVGGIFIEPLASTSFEDEETESITMGFGLMGIYQKDWTVFHLLLEGGAGYNFHEIVPLYDFRTWYLYESFSFGARAHYELGAGPMLGWQMGERWQWNAGAFFKEHHAPTYLLGIAYRIGEHHH